MKVGDLIGILEEYDRQQHVRFSVDDTSKPQDDPEDQDRIFCESGVADHFEDGHEVTLCLLGQSNRRDADQTWPMMDVLSKLTEAAETLLHTCGYDGHGWEEISVCVDRAKQIVSRSQ